MDKNCNYEIVMVDTSMKLTKEGFIRLCQKYGTVKYFKLNKTNCEHQAFIQFVDNNSAQDLLNEKLELPHFIKVDISNRSLKMMNTKIENYEDDENCNVDDNLEIISNEVVPNKTQFGMSVYVGPEICRTNLIEESEQLKIINNRTKFYNLENDDLFGRPLRTKWEKITKPVFAINQLEFYHRFENCMGGEIKVEKKLSPNMFTGWTTFFKDGENIQDTLKIISNDIECSDVLNINNLQYGMLVGALDNATNLYGRGYVTLVAGNSANVALSDYGRVINATKIRVLPEKYTQIPAYSFKVHTKGNHVPQLKIESYVFKVRSVCPERIVLIMFDGNKEIKVQLKKWQPTIEESGVPYIDLKNNSSVELLKLKDMNSVFIRSKEKHHFEFLFSSWNNLAAYCYKNPQPLNREPLYGEIVGFKSSITNNYVRARIHKFIEDNIYSVKHMDDPIKENINLSEMIELQFEHKSMPVSFLKTGLKNALPYPIQFDAKNFVEHVLDIRLTVCFDESNVEGWKYVDLNITLVKENLNSILYNLTEPLWLKDNCSIDSNEDYCKYMSLVRNELVEKSVVNLKFVVYDDGVFYMRDKLFGKAFLQMSSMIQEYCSLTLHPYVPHTDEVCLGKFPDGFWYRVIADKIRPGELAKVHSVDLGNIAYLNSRNTKRLPVELLFHQTHVYLCILDNPIEITEDKIKILKSYENTDCELTIEKSLGGKNHYFINCPFFNKILQ